jgi:RPA family protein
LKASNASGSVSREGPVGVFVEVDDAKIVDLEGIFWVFAGGFGFFC